MTLFVCSIAFKASDEDLRELFAAVGPLKRVFLATDREGASRGFGFIEFEDPLDAARAIDDLNGAELKGRKLIVMESKDAGQR